MSKTSGGDGITVEQAILQYMREALENKPVKLEHSFGEIQAGVNAVSARFDSSASGGNIKFALGKLVERGEVGEHGTFRKRFFLTELTKR